MPERIQLKRIKGWRMPPNTVKADRSTKWGNPFEVRRYGLELALKLFTNSIQGVWNPNILHYSQVSIAYNSHQEFLRIHDGHPLDNARRELAGKNLACWCEIDDCCHVTILLKLVNG